MPGVPITGTITTVITHTGILTIMPITATGTISGSRIIIVTIVPTSAPFHPR